MKIYRLYILIAFVISFLIIGASCRFQGFGGAGWDSQGDVEIAKQYPSIISDRISVITEQIPDQSFKQEFDDVFNDFPYHGEPISKAQGLLKTRINETPYSVAYENFVLKIFRDEVVIAERKLPNVFYMHPVSSGVILGKTRREDRIICRTFSRATTAMHYILVIDGNGDILFEKVVSGADDWGILPGNSGEIIIGGAKTKTIIFNRQLPAK